ncbi:DUF3854 domain-containing protein [Plectonema cf. radiosum LEGE 06105]|uniref:DUF3854 domain-containing protein n=2 Tax=Plectonema TaxID=1183 RepID=A0A8J7FP33_9CYAN|nr:DUF3854 domain-containing protein [Plectonema cf. radiosum LEGE 06105]
MEVPEASERLRIDAKYGGIWLEGTNGFGQFRPRKAFKTSEACKKALKYITALGEEHDAMLPNNPHNPRYWDDLEALKAQCYKIDGHPCLVLTEGMFSAIAPNSHGIPTLALAGVEMGLTGSKNDVQGKRYLVPALETLARAGFGWILGFDADAATKEGVVVAQRKLAAQLKKFNVPIYSITGLWSTSEGKGIDDYIQMNGFDKFRDEVLVKAETIQKWEQQFTNGEEKSAKKPTQTGFARELAEKYRAKLAWNIPAKAWYWYEAEGKAGIWGEIPNEQTLDLIVTELEAQNIDESANFINGVLTILKGKLRVNRWEVIIGRICLEDCVIDIRTLESTPHEPGYRFISRLPFKWSDRAVGCQPIKEWLLSTCCDRADWVEVIRAVMNATITERGAEFQRYIELIGAGGTGKGTILRLIQALLSKENYAVTTLKDLEKNQFETAMFYGKKAVFITDSERYAGEVGKLKAMTGADDLRIEKKGVQQTGSFTFMGVVWVACNEAIQSNDYTNALSRRRLSMSFEKVIPPHLRRDMIQEFKPYLPGLLAWVLSMPMDEVADYVRNTAKRVPSLGSFSVQVLLETNPLANWADQCLYYDPKAETQIGNSSSDARDCLYANYLQWASNNGHSGMTTQRFSSNLLNLLKTQLSIDASKRRAKNGRYITAIGIRQPGHNFPLLISGGDDPGDDPVTTSVTTESIGSADLQRNDDLFTNSYKNESVTHTTDSLYKEIEKPQHSRHSGSNPAPASNTGRHPQVTVSSPKPAQVVTNPPKPASNTNYRNAEPVGSADLYRFREGQTVYPTVGKYKGKQCKVSAIDDGEIWAHPITTQLGVLGAGYKPCELSLTPPIAPTTANDEYEPYQTSIDWENEEYLDCPDD